MMGALVKTIAETLLEQGEARGLKRGLAEGKAEVFLRLARIKFGDIPSARVTEVKAADETSLDHRIDALVAADTLAEVFDPRRHC